MSIVVQLRSKIQPAGIAVACIPICHGDHAHLAAGLAIEKCHLTISGKAECQRSRTCCGCLHDIHKAVHLEANRLHTIAIVIREHGDARHHSGIEECCSCSPAAPTAEKDSAHDGKS